MRHEVIQNLYDNVVNQVGNRAYDINGDLVDVDETKVAEEVKRLESEYEKQNYARSRAESYDPIPEQLDMIYHDIDGWKAKIKAVKDKYPKPT
jgi:hypothetical protein